MHDLEILIYYVRKFVVWIKYEANDWNEAYRSFTSSQANPEET